MPVRLKVQLVSVAEDGSESTEELLVLTKQQERLEQLGLTLAEGKQLLREAQQRVVQQQATAFLATRTACPTCGRQHSIKDHKTLSARTLFGKLRLDSPRVRQCCPQADGSATISPLRELISERGTPELQWLETRWASLASYGLTVRALQDFLPVEEELNISTVRRTPWTWRGGVKRSSAPNSPCSSRAARLNRTTCRGLTCRSSRIRRRLRALETPANEARRLVRGHRGQEHAD
jgi:hypothetical protein